MGRRLIAKVGLQATSRHLRWESFDARIRKGPPSVEAIAGTPRVHLFIEPAGRRIGARFFGRTRAVVASPLAEVTTREVRIGDDSALEVSTGNEALYRDFYALCCSIADRVQLDRQPAAKAVRETLIAWSALVRRKPLLSEERQVGLIGELLFLTRTAKSLGWGVAARSWYGPNAEEHDFVLPRADAEVKTTRREEPIHDISSLTQLSPKLRRSLHLVSIQLTAGSDGPDAIDLPRMVGSVLSAAQKSAPDVASAIRAQLDQQGWADEDAEHYLAQYYLRDAMHVIPVTRGFPAIVPDTLRRLDRDAAVRITRVSYSINLRGLGIRDGTKAFERALFQRRGRQ